MLQYLNILIFEQDRGYVLKEGRSLRVSSSGRVLSSFLTTYFPKYVDYGFTSSVEGDLDEISGSCSLTKPGMKGHLMRWATDLPCSCNLTCALRLCSWQGVLEEHSADFLAAF